MFFTVCSVDGSMGWIGYNLVVFGMEPTQKSHSLHFDFVVIPHMFHWLVEGLATEQLRLVFGCRILVFDDHQPRWSGSVRQILTDQSNPHLR
jgi:hypothetical protein